jgi:hypothetical protein
MRSGVWGVQYPGEGGSHEPCACGVRWAGHSSMAGTLCEVCTVSSEWRLRDLSLSRAPHDQRWQSASSEARSLPAVAPTASASHATRIATRDDHRTSEHGVRAILESAALGSVYLRHLIRNTGCFLRLA